MNEKARSITKKEAIEVIKVYQTGFYGSYYNPDKYTADETEESEGEQDV